MLNIAKNMAHLVAGSKDFERLAGSGLLRLLYLLYHWFKKLFSESRDCAGLISCVLDANWFIPVANCVSTEIK